MLSVGRELNIDDRRIVCRACIWEGEGATLATGLIRVIHAPFLVYAYRCPSCGSFNLNRKGRLLQFRSAWPVGHEASDAALSAADRPASCEVTILQ